METAQWEFDAKITKAFKDSDGKMHVKAIASDDLEDRQGDRIHKDVIISMAKQANAGDIELTRSHGDSFGIGTIFEAKAVHKKTRVQFAVDVILDEDFPESKKLFKDVKSGKRNRQLSIGGFIDLEKEDAITLEENKKGHLIRVINDLTLDHIAITRKNMAANPRTSFRQALVKSVESISIDDILKRAVVPYKAGTKADVEKFWNFSSADGSKLVDRGGIRLFRSAHTWFDSDKPELKTSHKLPHHKIDEDGTLKVFFRGVVAAGAVFAGARGGLNVPAKDRSGIASHLKRHYKQFDKEPPEALKSATGAENEEFVFAADEFVEFHKNQDIEMDWFDDWLEKGFDGDNSMSDDKTKKDDDEKVDDKKENKDDDKKAENKNDKDDGSHVEKLANVVSELIATLKAEDKELDEDVVKHLKSVRDNISDFLKEKGIEEDKKADEDDDDDSAEKDDIGDKLDSLQKSINTGQVGLATAVKEAIESIGKTVDKIAKSSQKSGRINDDGDDEIKKESVWDGLLVQK